MHGMLGCPAARFEPLEPLTNKHTLASVASSLRTPCPDVTSLRFEPSQTLPPPVPPHGRRYAPSFELLEHRTHASTAPTLSACYAVCSMDFQHACVQGREKDGRRRCRFRGGVRDPSQAGRAALYWNER